MFKSLSRLIGGLIIIGLLLIIPIGQSYSNGVGSSANNGCLCHGGSNDITQVELSGLPDKFESNTTYQLTLSIISDIDSESEASQLGGFRLLVSKGDIIFETIEQRNLSQYLDGGWTHTELGNQYRTWNLSWTSPEDNSTSVDFKVFGNGVNGNNNPLGDAWNFQNFKLGGVENTDDLIISEIEHRLEGYEKVMLGLAITTLCYLVYVVIK